MADPIRVCDVAALADGKATLVPAGTAGWTDDIALFRDGDLICALDDSCPHEEASLADGWIEDGAVECPQHQSRFDLRSGRVMSPPADRDAVPHRVEVRDGGVWLTPGEPPAAANP